MPNIANALKQEIARVARKEMRAETASLKKASFAFRSEIAALKRHIQDLERTANRAAKRTASAPEVDSPQRSDGEVAKLRFSAKGLATHRRRLGLSAADCGKLIGTSGRSIYQWEGGTATPRGKYLPAIAALRKMGKKEAHALLAARPPGALRAPRD